MTAEDSSVLALRVAEAAKRVSFPNYVIYDAIHSGALPAKKVGRTFRVKAADVDAWYEALDDAIDAS